MTIEEKWLKIEEYCYRRGTCSGCELCHVVSHRWDGIKRGEDEYVNKLYNVLNYGLENFTRNMAKVSDTFICEECGIHLEDCMKTVYDEDTEDTYCHEYEFKFCPECGRKIVEE